MSTITDELVLNVTQPLRAFEQMEQSVEGTATAARRLSTELDETQRNTQKAASAAGDFETRLKEVERAASRLNTETASMALSAGRAEGNFEGLATALNLSEDEARRLATHILEAQAAANRIQDASLQTARSLGLSEDEARRFASAMNTAARETRETDNAADGLSTRFQSIRGAALGLIAGFGAFAAVRGIIRGLGDLVDSFIEFDQAITQSLAIVSDVTPEIRDQFEAVARTVSTTLRFSAAEAGEAFFFLASAGFDVAQQLAALPKVAQFAQAGMFDLSTATTLLADSQTALGLRLKDPIANMRELTRVSDVLTKANILSNAEVQQFAEALTNRAASAARTVGVELEEVVAVLAAFADQGLKGAAAGEAFAIVLRDLQTAALKEEDTFAEFGIAVFDAAGEIRPLADVVEDLEGAFNGLSDAQTRQALIDLGFQDRSVANLLVLLGTSDAIRDYTTELQNAGGATQELADKQLLSLGARLEIAGNAFENAKISLGESLVPAVEAFIAILPGLIQQVENLAPALEGVATSFGQAAPAVADFVGQFLRFLEAAPRSIGILTNIGQILGDLQFNIVPAAAQGDLNRVADTFGRIKENVENIQFNRLEQGLVDAIRGGRESLLALADTFAELDEGEGGVTFENIARLARTAGVEGKNLAAVLQAVVARSKEFGLTAAQVKVYELAIRDLTETSIEAVRQQNFIARAVAALPTELENAARRIEGSNAPVVTFFNEISALSEETGKSFAELVLDSEGLADGLLAALDPAEALGITLQAMAIDTEGAADRFRNSLAPAFVDASEALIDFNKNGIVSLTEFIRGLEETAVAASQFALNIAAIFAVSPEVAAAVQALPRDVGALLAAELAKNPIKILEASTAQSQALSDTIRGLVTQAMGFLQAGDFEGLEQFTDFVTTLDVPGATDAIAAQVNAALPGVSALLDPDVITFDLSGVGEEAGITLITGMVIGVESGTSELGEAVENTTRNALQMQSPSKLMVSLGEQAGFDLLSGFVSAANRPIPVLTGIQIGGAGGLAGQAAGNVSTVTVNQTINHPTLSNLLTDIAQLDQTTGAAAAGLRAF